MKKTPRLLVLLVGAALVGGLFSCGRKSESPGKTAEPGAGKLLIAVIPKGMTHEFWKSVHVGAIQAGREMDVEILWKGPQKEDDRAQQITVVEDVISRGVNGIVLAPLDDRALVRPVDEAMRANKPVVIIDSRLQGDNFVSYVATDNYRGGVLAAERLSELLNGRGKIFMIRYQEGSASTMEREQGFLDTMKAKSPDVQFLVQDQYTGATTETAYQLVENLLSRFPDVEGIFCPNESSTFGALRALQEAHLAGKVKFVGFDSSPKLVQALRDGQLQGLILQNPVKMGYLGVQTAVRHLRGEAVEKVIDTGVVCITPETMDTPANQALLNPDLSILDK
jgi:ribose transport system substrate-binding protein